MARFPDSYETQGLMAAATGTERLAGVISHGSMLIGLPLFVPILVLVLYPLVGGRSRFVRHTAVQALLFQLLIAIVGGGLVAIAGAALSLPVIAAVIPVLGLLLAPIAALVGWPLGIAIGAVGVLVLVWGVWIEIVATWKAFNGESYRMPIVGGFGS